MLRANFAPRVGVVRLSCERAMFEAGLRLWHPAELLEGIVPTYPLCHPAGHANLGRRTRRAQQTPLWGAPGVTETTDIALWVLRDAAEHERP